MMYSKFNFVLFHQFLNGQTTKTLSGGERPTTWHHVRVVGQILQKRQKIHKIFDVLHLAFFSQHAHYNIFECSPQCL